jgi:hypothetical protein
MHWNAFVNRLEAGKERPTLAEVGAVLRTFVWRCISRESPRDSGPHWNLSHHWRRKGLSARQVVPNLGSELQTIMALRIDPLQIRSSREEAIELLDEVGNADVAEVFIAKRFMAHFQLKKQVDKVEELVPVDFGGFGEET